MVDRKGEPWRSGTEDWKPGLAPASRGALHSRGSWAGRGGGNRGGGNPCASAHLGIPSTQGGCSKNIC